MRVIISAGGTGGHIYPALAIVEEIKKHEPSSQFLYIGTHNRMENDIVPKKNIPFESIEMYGFNKKKLLKNFKTLKCLFKAYKKCKKLIKKFNPDIVIGVGGYVTVPVIVSAKKLGYKTFIHEQNSIPGKSNKYLAKYSDIIGVSFPSSIKYFPNEKTIITGNPASEKAVKTPAITKTELGLSASKKLVLITMGSLGAGTINKYLIKNLNNFKNKNYEVLIITGKANYSKFSENILPTNVKILPFYDGLTRIMKRTDLMISRAGATTISELIALEVPAILIPSPYVANNHQYINALDLINEKASVMLEEKELMSDKLINMIDSLIEDQIKLRKIKNNLKKLQIENSSLIIYNKIKEIIE